MLSISSTSLSINMNSLTPALANSKVILLPKEPSPITVTFYQPMYYFLECDLTNNLCRASLLSNLSFQIEIYFSLEDVG